MNGDATSEPQPATASSLLGLRYMARFIDMGIVSVLIAGATIGPTLLFPSIPGGMHGPLMSLVMPFVLWIGYETLFEASPWHATYGKRLMGLRVCGSGTDSLSVSQAAIRNLVKDGPFVVATALPGGRWIGLAWLAAHIVVVHRSAANEGIHDRAAHTRVAAGPSSLQ